MTPEEKHLWYDFLKKLPITVHRQKNIGNYIVDFYVAHPKTVIELDGSQHKDEEHEITDVKRDAFLVSFGITVLRYPNTDVKKHFYEVCCDIAEKLELNIDVSALLADEQHLIHRKRSPFPLKGKAIGETI